MLIPVFLLNINKNQLFNFKIHQAFKILTQYLPLLKKITQISKKSSLISMFFNQLSKILILFKDECVLNTILLHFYALAFNYLIFKNSYKSTKFSNAFYKL